MRHIDSEELVTALTRMVQVKGPKFVYRDPWGGHSQCAYVHLEDKDADREDRVYLPGCGVGQVLYDLNVISLRGIFEGYHNDDDASSFLRYLQSTEKASFSGEAAEILGTFQLHQDHGDTWGTALKLALASPENENVKCDYDIREQDRN